MLLLTELIDLLNRRSLLVQVTRSLRLDDVLAIGVETFELLLDNYTLQHCRIGGYGGDAIALVAVVVVMIKQAGMVAATATSVSFKT